VDVQVYLNEIRALAASGQATEHSYRPALERLFKSVASDVSVINEPKRLTDVGAPDFVFNRNGVSIGWCEAKDLTKDITKFKTGDYSKEQKARYAKGLPNLIYTNGTDFEFIRKGEVTGFVSIADLIPTLPARPDQFERLEMLLKDFAAQTPISINTAKQLAEMMAGKAVIIKDIMGNALTADTAAGVSTELTDQYEGFKTSLIHDITIADFADVYAETIAYGLFAARLHDTTMDSFNRAEALELLPKSNPFLRNLFVYIAGPNLDDRLKRMIDDLCDVFRACDVGALMQDFGKFTARNDPFLHFYETFLAEYNPAKRKARGVWYTPEPVVNFIVRAVDDVLKTEFGLPMGLADTSKISIDWDSGQNDPKTGKPVMMKKDVHRVQILDPATGTGTFLAEAIKQIAAQVKGVAEGMWSSYVERDLIPRLHGFELLMASYAMCHMKLDMMLTDMGYKPSASPPRLGVYLTNSLEEGERVEQTLPFARWLSEEAKGANTIKRDTPIMCVIGNPPYSGHSSNKGPWIEGLMADYKVSAELKRPAQAKWLSDDYVKFIRFAEHMIEKNGEGILGFITNHSYLDNPTFMDMRHRLLQTFDVIYILDLNGSTKKQQLGPDGEIDRNVFDIMQGVSIIIGVRRPTVAKIKNEIGLVHHLDVWGSRDSKNQALWNGKLGQMDWTDIQPRAPNWMFVPQDHDLENLYLDSLSLKNLFSPNGDPAPAMVTTQDQFAISWTKVEAVEKVNALLASANEFEARKLYRLCSQSQWNYDRAKIALSVVDWQNEIRTIAYRPFDNRITVYNSNVAVHRRERLNRHFGAEPNIGLISCRQSAIDTWEHVFVTDKIVDDCYISNRTKERGYVFPLYLYPEEGTLETERRINFDPRIYAEIRARAGLSKSSPLVGEVGGGRAAFAAQKTFSRTSEPGLSAADAAGPHPNPPHKGEGSELPDELPDELRVFDYIYGVLHSPDYRRTYAQFLKIDFPRIPYPASPEVFAHVAEKGGQLRRLHLMEDAAIGATPYPFKGEGDNVVVKPALTEDGRVMINPDQYFEGVPAVAWDFHIGGYQPAQKWLKDRKGRALSFDDVVHYQKIIKILIETDRIMREIILPL
jgi:type I restriction-modification system DNA methylase subunit